MLTFRKWQSNFSKNYIFACILTKRGSKIGQFCKYFRRFRHYIVCKLVLKENYYGTLHSIRKYMTHKILVLICYPRCCRLIRLHESRMSFILRISCGLKFIFLYASIKSIELDLTQLGMHIVLEYYKSKIYSKDQTFSEFFYEFTLF